MIGAVVGDVVGSVHEHNGTKTLDFPLLRAGSRLTADTVLTVASAEALLSGEPYERADRRWGRRYPVRAAISLGGDADTQAAIAGAAAAAYDGGVPREVEAEVRRWLPPDACEVLDAFEARYPLARRSAPALDRVPE
jgi:ADP-ribosylglycohydrolase